MNPGGTATLKYFAQGTNCSRVHVNGLWDHLLWGPRQTYLAGKHAGQVLMQPSPKGEREVGKELLLISDSLQDGDTLAQLSVDCFLQSMCSICAVPDCSCARERRVLEDAFH